MTHVEVVGFPEPPAIAGEAETLLGSLERQRATFAWKCADLDDAGLRMSVGASTMTLGGLLKHLAYLEDVNFTGDLAGPSCRSRGRTWNVSPSPAGNGARPPTTPQRCTPCGNRPSTGPGAR
ncbi:DUF664 domain-containing protein [Catellatospora citrea]|uniref:mycothiol transferase n=1 Tax=Catellatospora citrea TaxID=53366 RepID=UPI0033C36627